MPEVILPCPNPKCGSDVKISGGDEWHNQHSFFIECQCGVCRVGDTVRAECIDRWNALPRSLRWAHEPPKVAGDCYIRTRPDESEPWDKPFVVNFSESYLKELYATPLIQYAGPIPLPLEG